MRIKTNIEAERRFDPRWALDMVGAARAMRYDEATAAEKQQIRQEQSCNSAPLMNGIDEVEHA